MIYLLTPRDSIPYARDYLERAGLEGDGDCLGYEDLPGFTELPPGLFVFTGLNRLGPSAVSMFGVLHDQIWHQTGRKPLNDPRKTLRRFELLRALQANGLNDFRVFQAREDISGARFPVFVRTRERDGYMSPLLDSKEAVDRAIGRGIIDGFPLEELLVVEFLDTSDQDGVYRKYSAYVVGSRVIPVSLDVGPDWILRRGSRTKASVDEELRFVEENPHNDQVSRIFSLSNTEFGRIDYSLKGDRVQTWEINTLPTLRRPLNAPAMPEEIRLLREPRKRVFEAAYSAAWQEVLCEPRVHRPTRVNVAEDLLAKAQRELSSRGATTEPGPKPYPRLRRFLGPLKAPLIPVFEKALCPLLARRAKRLARE